MTKSLFFTQTSWPDHVLNGGTGVTKLSEPHLSQFQKSVSEFNDPEIFIKSGPNGLELHTTRKRFDLSDFWAFHKEINNLQ